MVLFTITFPKEDVTPPVYVAGSFSNWQPVEMDHTQINSQETTRYKYTKQLDLPPGSHQYKFRLGDGDWWMVDESAWTARDGDGNLNNAIEVPDPEPEHRVTQPEEEKTAVFHQKTDGRDEFLSPSPSSLNDASIKSPSANTEAVPEPSSTRKLVGQDKYVRGTTSNDSSEQQQFNGSSSAKDSSKASKPRQPVHHRFFLSCCTTQNSVLLSGVVLVAAVYYVWKH